MCMLKNKKMLVKDNKYPIIIILGIFLMIVFLLGMLTGLWVGAQLAIKTMFSSIEKINVNNVNVGFNETYIMDRVDKMTERLKVIR
jgi:hypothetical protein